MKPQPEHRRVNRRLAKWKLAPAYQWDDVPDPRSRRGVRWRLSHILDAVLHGLMTACASLRHAEQLTKEMAQEGSPWAHRRVPDTTMYDLLSHERLDPAPLREKLHRQIKLHERGKRLRPVGLPCGVLSIDGKGVGCLEHDADGTAQKGHRRDGSPYWLGRVLRAALTSSGAHIYLDQMPIAAKTNEMGAFAAFYTELLATYGGTDLFEVVTGDAGFTSKANADLVHRSDRAYVFALKETQPELLREARRLLRPLAKGAPDAETEWERAKGAWVRRRLWRTAEIAGYHGWEHLQQAWLQIKETRKGDQIEIEERYFVTSLRPGRLTAAQSLLVIRRHWGIENDCHGSLDMQWDEDSAPWCTKGHALEVLGLMRMMAYDVAQLLRQRTLRERRPDGRRAAPPAWCNVLRWVRKALELPQPTPTASVA